MKIELKKPHEYKPVTITLDNTEEFRTLWHALKVGWGESLYEYTIDNNVHIDNQLRIDMFALLNIFKEKEGIIIE